MYEGLKGKELMIAYFRDHGLTEEEIAIYDFWHCYEPSVKPDEKGMAYMQEMTEKMIRYRDLTADEIRKDPSGAVWWWPNVLCFEGAVWEIPKTNADVKEILQCTYNGETYYFGIGKEEPTITEDMRENGDWRSQTFTL